MRRHLTRGEARAHDPHHGIPRGFPTLADLPVEAIPEARAIAHAAAMRLPNGGACGLLREGTHDPHMASELITAFALGIEYARRRMRWESIERINKRKKELES